ncbi:unnamed protein product [Linum trigynum]|uniref:Uncharacterized protein n=1 Tax=Linum trigynum TaxID=586398 RepID=A0AAV2EBJ3_9ROSI
MATRILVRARQPLLLQLKSPQGLCTTSRLLVDISRSSSHRRFSVFNDVKEEVKRMKQTTVKLCKRAYGFRSETEATAEKLATSVQEKISAAMEEVKATSTMGKPVSAESTGNLSENIKANTKEAEALFAKFKSRIPGFSSAFQRMEEAKLNEIMKAAYDIAKEELNDTMKDGSNNGDRIAPKHVELSPSKGETSTNMTDVAPLSNQKLAEDMEERSVTASDNPIVDKIQEVGATKTGVAAAPTKGRRRFLNYKVLLWCLFISILVYISYLVLEAIVTLVVMSILVTMIMFVLFVPIAMLGGGGSECEFEF